MYGVVGAYVDAVEAVDASRSVDNMVVEVDALGFAYVGTSSALDAFVGVDVDLEYCKPADKSESSAYGAYRGAYQTS